MVNNTLVGHADDITLVVVVLRESDRTPVTDSFNADLAVISDWCLCWGMKLNAGKTKDMTVSRSRMLDSHFPNLLVNGVQLESMDRWRYLACLWTPS